MSESAPNILLPGADLVDQGIADLSQNRLTDCALLVLIAAPRLERLGFRIPRPPVPKPYEHALYARLEQRLGTAAHSYYNSLIRRIVSYARALEREQSREAPEDRGAASQPAGQLSHLPVDGPINHAQDLHGLPPLHHH